MKKLFVIAAMAALSLGMQAQEKLSLSTYNGTNLTRYDGKVCDVTVNRYMFTGWNTIALPFDMSEQELDEVFGSDCRLELLAGAEDNVGGVKLNFINCKEEGMKANTPYMLYYTGEASTKTIKKTGQVTKGEAVREFTTQSGESVAMIGAMKHTDGEGLYGVLARDNSEVKFVSVGEENTTGFYATRCYIRLGSGTAKLITSQHFGYGETTTISAIARMDEVVDVYSTTGAKVASQMRASEINSLHTGLYIVKGHKILVK